MLHRISTHDLPKVKFPLFDPSFVFTVHSKEFDKPAPGLKIL